MSNPFVNSSFNNSNDVEEVHHSEGTETTGSTENGSQSESSSKHSSWVKFDENGSRQSNGSLEPGNVNGSIRAIETKTNDKRSISSISTDTSPPVGDPLNNFATIELSNSIEITHPPRAILQQPGSSMAPVKTSHSQVKSSEGQFFSTAVATTSTSTTTTASSGPVPPNSNANASNETNHFANGDIIVNLLPLNDGWDWVTPAKFKAHLVPEELMAQSLTLTVEDYVTTMSVLFNDYRFNFYIVFYKRVLGLWISLGILVLLCILFSGWKGMPLFIAGMMWLILNALGIFAAIYVKSKLHRMLEQAIAQVNAVFSKHNIFLGVDDRGRYSCHKVNLVFVYFDAKYCVKFLQDMLNNSEQQVISSRMNNNQVDSHAMITLSNTVLSIDTSDIIITGSTPKNISQKEKYAEKLLLRYSQRWIREYNRERIELNPPQPATSTATTTTSIPSASSSSGSNGMMNNQQPHPTSTTTAKSQALTVIPMSARHCRGHKCFCQFIEEHLKYKPLTTCSFTELLY